MKPLATTVVLLSLAVPSAAQLPQEPPRGEGWVVLPVAEYRALRLKAFPSPPAPEPPPVAATITRVDYDLTVQPASATGQARLTTDVFREGWVTLPVPAGIRIRDARVESGPARIVDRTDRSGAAPALLLSRPGRSVVTLDIAVPVAEKAGVESLLLPPAEALIQRLALVLPGADVGVSVAGAFLAERTGLADTTRVVVYGRPHESMFLEWGRRRPAPNAALPLRLRAAVTEIVGLGEEAAQVSAEVVFDVAQGAAGRVSIVLPPGFVVADISGPSVGDWQMRAGECEVTLIEPAERSVTVRVTGDMRVPREGVVTVPLIRAGGVDREAGAVGVEVIGAGEIKAHVARGLDPADPSELGSLGASRASPALAAFRLRPQPGGGARALEVSVARYTPQAVLLANIEEGRYTALLAEDGKVLVEARYAVRNSQRSFLGVALPASATLWSTSVDGRPVRPGRGDRGGLLLPILRSRPDGRATSAVSVLYVVRGTRWAETGTAEVPLPAVDLPISRTGLVVYHSSRYKLTLEPGAFRLEPYRPPASGVLGGPPGTDAIVVRAAEVEGRVGKDEQGLQDLAGAYQRAARAGFIAGLIPVDLPFPAVGPSLFLAAELTAEGHLPVPRFTFKRQVK